VLPFTITSRAVSIHCERAPSGSSFIFPAILNHKFNERAVQASYFLNWDC
jgi:hypothetical protein